MTLVDGTLTVRTVRTVGMYRVPSPRRHDGIRYAATKAMSPAVPMDPGLASELYPLFFSATRKPSHELTCAADGDVEQVLS